VLGHAVWFDTARFRPSIRRARNTFRAGRRSVEYPFGNFEAAGIDLRRTSAPKYPRASPGDHFVHENPKAKPWMPGIKYFPLFGPVGVMLSSCTTRSGRMSLLATSRPHRKCSCLPSPRGRLRYGFAGHTSATANSQLTFHLNHSVGADQCHYTTLPALFLGRSAANRDIERLLTRVMAPTFSCVYRTGCQPTLKSI